MRGATGKLIANATLSPLGLRPLMSGVRSCFWLKMWKMFLVVYVDDFKLAGPKALMKECWDSIRRGIRTDDPIPVGKYLGCDQKTSQRSDPKSGAKLHVVGYDMSDCMRFCVDSYVELAGVERSSLKKVCTPFLAEPREPSLARDPMKSSDDLNNPAIEPSGGIDATRGRLQPIAARVLMKVLHGARVARYDLLRAVNGLAMEITKWTPRCDLRLHCFMSYVCHTLDMKLYVWVGDKAESLRLDLPVDACLAGETTQSCKSTSGVFFAVCGPNNVRDGLLLASRRNNLLLRIARLSPRLLRTTVVFGQLASRQSCYGPHCLGKAATKSNCKYGRTTMP